MATPRSNSARDIAAFIREYIDPAGTFKSTDDAAEAVAALDAIWADEGGCGVTVDQLAEYLESLGQ